MCRLCWALGGRHLHRLLQLLYWSGLAADPLLATAPKRADFRTNTATEFMSTYTLSATKNAGLQNEYVCITEPDNLTFGVWRWPVCCATMDLTASPLWAFKKLCGMKVPGSIAAGACLIVVTSCGVCVTMEEHDKQHLPRHTNQTTHIEDGTNMCLASGHAGKSDGVMTPRKNIGHLDRC